MSTDTYVCPQCKHAVRMTAKPRRSFMGFARIPCPSCNTEFRYPLPTAYVVVYWLLLLGNVGYLVFVLSQGQGFVPNPIGIVVLVYVVISLVKNSSLKRSVMEVSKSAIDAPPLQVAAVEGVSKDRARWYHLLIAVMLPYVALPWGIVNLCLKKKGSGLMLTIPSAIILLIIVITIVSSLR
jgi:hypothetical protein